MLGDADSVADSGGLVGRVGCDVCSAQKLRLFDGGREEQPSSLIETNELLFPMSINRPGLVTRCLIECFSVIHDEQEMSSQPFL